jgi:hypothetical protein
VEKCINRELRKEIKIIRRKRRKRDIYKDKEWMAEGRMYKRVYPKVSGLSR